MSGNYMSQDTYEQLNIDVSLLFINHVHFNNDFNYNVHSHGFLEMFIAINGKGSILVEDEGHVPIEKGDIILLNSMVGHTEYSDHNNPIEFLILGFSGFDYSSLNDESKNQRYVKFEGILNTPYGQNIDDTAYKIYQELEKKEKYSSYICDNYLMNIILTLLRNEKVKISEKAVNAKSKQVLYILQYIDSHISSKLTLKEILSATYCSKYHILHSFKKEVGMPIFSYILKRKCEEAILLLQNSDSTIQSISDCLSFSSVSYFHQQFKKFTGRTPLSYRKKQ